MTPTADVRRALDQYQHLAKIRPRDPVTVLAPEVGLSARTVYRYLGAGHKPKAKAATAKFTKESALAAFKDTCALYFGGKRPTSGQYMALRGAPVSYQTLLRLFGGWDDVLVSAGFTPIKWRTEGLPRKMRLTADDLDRLR